MIRVPLKRGGVVVAHALVDDEDAWVLKHCWRLADDGYAIRTIWDSAAGTSRINRMHRDILGLRRGDGVQTDHRNRNRIDNRRENLRLATAALNRQNTDARPGSSSAARGVYFNRHGKWCANVKLDNKTHYLGSYENEDEAARVAAEFRAEYMPFSEDAEAA